jgi:hypothetical protein
MARIVIQTADRNGDDVTVTGTVDGTLVTAHTWWSHLASLGTNPPDRTAMTTYLARLLKVQHDNDAPLPDLGLGATIDIP